VSAFEAIFNPRRVAVVGASDREGKMGALFMDNLAGFEGEVVPVTTSQETVAGAKAYPSLRDVPGTIDLAVILVPAEAVPGVMSDAAEAGVSAAVVISGGFAEAGPEGAGLQKDMLAAAGAGGVRVVGPNCFGVQNCNAGLNASMAGGTPAPGGDIALVTQSGAYGMAIYTLGVEERIRFSKVYAAGNKADIDDAEVLTYLGDDDDSSVLCLFLESIDPGRAWYEAARRITPEKPVIVAKTGRTEAGARAAVSHTAAMAGAAAVAAAAIEQAGAVVVASGLEMADTAKALDWQPLPGGPRVGIITNSGGTGVELTDLLGEAGLVVPELSDALQGRLTEVLPPFAGARNPVDITPAWRRFAELYAFCLEELASSGEVDIVVVVLLQRSALDPEVAASVRDAVARLRTAATEVPVYVCWVAPREAQANADLLQGAGIPCFQWPQRTARALGHAWGYARRRTALRQAPARPERPAGLALPAEGLVGPEEAAGLMATFGISVPGQVVCGDVDAAAAAAEDLGYPVVAKAVAGRLTHKSESGGVRVGLTDAAAVRSAAEELFGLDDEARVLIQEQVTGVEVIVGGYRDAGWGPGVMVGLGGVFVELLQDTVLRLAPIDRREAAAALRSLRGYGALSGARGRRPVDLDALADVIAATSRLMASLDEVSEIDLNPVIATSEGATAVDVRVLVRESS